MKKSKVVLGVVLILALATALVSAQKSQTESGTGGVQRAVFKVENLTCGACLTAINSALSPEEGFAGMGSNLWRGMVAVDFTAPLTPEKIGKAITGLGYPATLDSLEHPGEKETFAYMQSRRQGRGPGCCGGQAAVPQCPGGGTGCLLDGGAPVQSKKDI